MCFNRRINDFMNRITSKRKKYKNICEESPLLLPNSKTSIIKLIVIASAKISELKEIDTILLCEIMNI